jgi:hypothetical protein
MAGHAIRAWQWTVLLQLLFATALPAAQAQLTAADAGTQGTASPSTNGSYLGSRLVSPKSESSCPPDIGPMYRADAIVTGTDIPYRNREIGSGFEASAELGPIDRRRYHPSSRRPRQTDRAVEASRGVIVHHRMKAPTLLAVARHRGTDSSNPFSSSGESCANLRRVPSAHGIRAEAPDSKISSAHGRCSPRRSLAPPTIAWSRSPSGSGPSPARKACA